MKPLAPTLMVGALAICMPSAVLADEYDDLIAALRLEEVVGLMVDEGIGQGVELRADLALGVSLGRWRQQLTEIYDPARMMAEVRPPFEAAITPEQAEQLTAFFNSPVGQRITEAEISTREIFGEPGIEEAAIAAAQDMPADTPLRRDVSAFIWLNDLVAYNVMGTLNDQLAFNLALADSGALGPEFNQDQLLADLWSDVDALNADTESWLTGFLVMAYEGLEEGDLAAYVEVSATEPGQALNEALFAGFDAAFVRISRELGLAAGSLMLGQEL